MGNDITRNKDHILYGSSSPSLNSRHPDYRTRCSDLHSNARLAVGMKALKKEIGFLLANFDEKRGKTEWLNSRGLAEK